MTDNCPSVILYKTFKNNKLKSVFVAVCLASSGSAMASGFQLWEQDASGIGDYHSGYATPDSASAVFYNPAAMSDLPKAQFTGGITAIKLTLPFRGTVQVTTNSDILGPSVGAPAVSNTNGDTSNFVPNAYMTVPLTDKFAVGIGAATPFGLSTDYGEMTNVKFAATNTTLKTVDIMPAASYRFNDRFSLGAGLDAQYAWADFDQYAGFAQSGTTSVSLPTASLNSGNSWGWGYHFGFLFNATDNTVFGFSYHSKIRENLKGTSKFIGALNDFLVQDPTAVITSNTLNATFYTPAYASMTLMHHVNNKWDVLGTLDYTQWSSFKRLQLNDVVAAQGEYATVVIQEGYRNTWNVALGAHYKENDKILWKFGLGFDETPTNNQDRNLQLPGQNRIAVALGIRGRVSDRAYIDAGYTHLFQMRANINTSQFIGTDSTSDTTTTRGSVNGSANVAGIQLTVDLG